MQKLELLFVLAVMLSLIVSIPSTLAQETGANVTEGVVDDTMTEETDDTMTEETDDTMETMADEPMAPLKQLMSGVDPHEVQCKTGQKLVFKASNFRPVCIKESSYDVLLAWGWVSDHDPTHEELAKMTDDVMASLPQMEETDDAMMEETEMMGDSMGDGASLEEGLALEEDASSDDEPDLEAQNFTINLSESMSMGAQ